jgi:hypothetical protein
LSAFLRLNSGLVRVQPARLQVPPEEPAEPALLDAVLASDAIGDSFRGRDNPRFDATGDFSLVGTDNADHRRLACPGTIPQEQEAGVALGEKGGNPHDVIFVGADKAAGVAALPIGFPFFGSYFAGTIAARHPFHDDTPQTSQGGGKRANREATAVIVLGPPASSISSFAYLN